MNETKEKCLQQTYNICFLVTLWIKCNQNVLTVTIQQKLFYILLFQSHRNQKHPHVTNSSVSSLALTYLAHSSTKDYECTKL